MKQILPILTLTTLSAAAFADAGAAAPAAASGLVYNRVTVQQNTSGPTNRDIGIDNLVNGSNVLLSLHQLSYYQNGPTSQVIIGIGYVFKNVTSGIDATVGITNGENDGITLNLRRSLSEVIPGLEVALGFSKYQGQSNQWSYEVAYNINKQFSVAFAASDFQNDNVKSVAVRYNY
jgi:hypothetical protein